MGTLEDHGPGVSEDIPILPSGGMWNPLKGLRQGGSLPLVGMRPSSSFQFCFHRVGRLFLWALCLSVSVFLCFVLWTYWTDIMGQTQTTPLSIMIDHLKDVKGRADNLSVEV